MPATSAFRFEFGRSARHGDVELGDRAAIGSVDHGGLPPEASEHDQTFGTT